MKLADTLYAEQNQLNKPVIHKDAAPNTNITGGVEGQLAYDTANDQLMAHNGTTFTNVGEVGVGGAGIVKTGSTYDVEITGGATTNSVQGLAFSASGASGTLGVDSTRVATFGTAGTFSVTHKFDAGLYVSSGGTASGTVMSDSGIGISIIANGTNGNVNLVPNGTGTVVAASKRITSVADPTSAQDAATKNYVDTVGMGLDAKPSVRVVSTSNITTFNSGDTIDGVTLADGDRVLVAGQSDPSQNGIWVVAASPVRADDANAAGELSGGSYVWVEEGSSYADTGWVITTNGSITPGTTSHTWTQFTGAAMITAGAGLGKSGNTISITDAELLAIAGLTSAADKVPYFTGSGTASLATLTSQARDLIDDTSFGAMRTTLGAAGLADANTFTVPQIIDLSVTGTALTLDVNTSGDKWISFTESANERGVIAELSDGILVEATDDSLTLKGAGAVNINPVAGVANFNSSRLTSVANATADTDALNRQTGDGRYCRVATGTMGSTAAITITHNFNTRAVITEVYTTSAPYDKVDCTVTHDTVNAVTFTFNSAPSAGAYTYVIMGIDT